MNHPFFLAADIGATKTNIGLYTFAEGLTPYSQTVQLRTADFSGVEALLAKFLTGRRGPVSFCVLGVPGPVDSGRAEVTNLPWVIDENKVNSI